MHRPLALLAGLAALTSAIAGAAVVAPSAPARANATELRLVAYSTPREAYAQLIPMFQKTGAGKDVSFSQSYGASGEQARAVKAGLDADLVALSLAPDVDGSSTPGSSSRAGRRSPTRAWSPTPLSSSSSATGTRRRSGRGTTS